MKSKEWNIRENERAYEATTIYDSASSYRPKTKVVINMSQFIPNAKPEVYKKTNNGSHYVFLARVTSEDGMCHMTFNIVNTLKEKYFEVEFYDILVYSYGVPKLQKIHVDLSKYADIKLDSLPKTVEAFVEQLLGWFEALKPLLDKHRDKIKKDAEAAQLEVTVAESEKEIIK